MVCVSETSKHKTRPHGPQTVLAQDLNLLFLFNFLLQLFVFLLLALPIIRRLSSLILRFPQHDFLTRVLTRFHAYRGRFICLLFILRRGTISRVPIRRLLFIRLARALYLHL